MRIRLSQGVIPRRTTTTYPLILLTLLVFPLPGTGQEVIDEGVLLIRRGREVIAREEFQVQVVSTGYQITSTVSYPPRRTRVVMNSVLGLNTTFKPVSYESSARGARRVIAQFGTRRVVFRRESERGESAREYPAAERMLVVSDSIFALVALAHGLPDGPIRLMWPRTDRQGDYDLTSEDIGTVEIAGRQVQVRRMVLTAGPDRREFWFDSLGRLVRIRIPSDGIEIDRSWDGTGG